jgi:hypothetical protein
MLTGVCEVLDGAISEPNVALHFTIGHDAKGKINLGALDKSMLIQSNDRSLDSISLNTDPETV